MNTIFAWIILILGILGFAFLIKYIRKMIIARKEKFEAHEEVLKDFNELERRLKESNGEKDAYTIIWEYAGERGERARRTNFGTERKIIEPTISREPTNEDKGSIEGRSNIQNGNATIELGSIGSDTRTNPKSFGNFFSRFRKK